MNAVDWFLAGIAVGWVSVAIFAVGLLGDEQNGRGR